MLSPWRHATSERRRPPRAPLPSLPRAALTSLTLASLTLSLLTMGHITPLSEAQAQIKVVSDSAPQATPPYQLTTQDGTGLELLELEAKAVVDGPLAFTELHLTFKNPHNRQIEGRFEVTMPDRAAISRFAMKIKGAWMEGEVVEKQAARRAYEDALHRRQDPALLEQDAGNQFRARVFPIMPNEEKELIISWSQELSSARERYSLPLMGLPKMRKLSLTALVAKVSSEGSVKSSLGGESARYEVTTVQKRDFAPTQDWTLSGGVTPELELLRSGDIALTRVTMPEAELSATSQPHLIALFDSSASRMIGYEERLARLEELASGLTSVGVERLSVVAFDQEAALIFDGRPQDFGPQELTALKERDALGASSLKVGVEAVKRLLTSSATGKPSARRALLMSDGVYTYGPSQPAELSALIVEGLRPLGVERVDAFVDQSARDISALEAIVTSSGLQAGKVLTLEMSAEERLKRLKAGTFGELKVEVPGAEWTWPASLKGLQAGDQALIYAQLSASRALELKLSGGALTSPLRFEPSPREADEAMLERAWVRARIERLMSKMSSPDPDMKGVWREQVIKLSTKHRVLSPYTALVVLESEAMYQRFGIKRDALSDILMVGAKGVERVGRTAPVVLPPPPPPPPPKPTRSSPRRALKKSRARGPSTGAANGLGGLGRVGRGAGGGGAAPRAARPSTRSARPSVDDLTQALPQANRAPSHESAPLMELSAPAPSQDDRLSGAEPEVMAEEAPMAEAAPMDEVAPMVEAEPMAAPSSASRSALNAPASASPPPPPRERRLAIAADEPAQPPAQVARERRPRAMPPRRQDSMRKKGAPALTGEMAEIARLTRSKNSKKHLKALKLARAWRAQEPTNPLTLIALGLALEANGDLKNAARAFGSVIDFFPSRADMRRLASNWLERLGEAGLTLAEASYREAAEQRPDHPSVYHMWAMTLVKLNRPQEALEVALKGIKAPRAENRFREVGRILQEDAQLIGAAWAASSPKERDAISELLTKHNLSLDTRRSTRFILSWENDANDVDFHIYDARGGHAFYSQKSLPSGGSLYADITTGYGPECFTIYDPSAAPYSLQAHYYRRGPMGYGAGKLQVLTHNGEGRLSFEERPFVIMNDGAYVDLGEVSASELKAALK